VRLASAAAAVLLASLGLGAGAAHGGVTAEQTALKGIASAVASGRIPPDQATFDRAAVVRAARLWPKLRGARGAALSAVLDDVAGVARAYNRPRALALFQMLKENSDYLASHALSGRVHQDIADSDGVVYRYFPGHGFQFHPLGNFGALNAAVASGDQDRTRRLADALLARGVSNGAGGLVWEYYFRFSAGRPPWTSGMAQAVATQALARASKLLDDPTLSAAAARAYQAIPGRLVRHTSFGPWIRLYSFSGAVVFNAELQSAISLADFSALTGDAAAGALAGQMRTAAAAGLGSFDTGFWSLYALPSDDSPLDYHLYVVSLLRKLAGQDPRFGAAATRFLAYTKQPPAFKLADSGGSGVLFWLSKPGTVTVTVGSGSRSLSLGDGWHRVSWAVGTKAAALPVHLVALDYAGNRAGADALPLVRAALARASTRKSSSAAPATGQPSFLAAAGLDSPGQAQTAAADGFRSVRIVVPWEAAQAAPGADTVSALNSAAGVRLIVQLAYAAPDPSLAAFAAALVQQVPSIRDVLVGSPGQPAAGYVATLGAVRDAIDTVNPQVRIAGVASDTGALAALGASFRASGRSQPIMDELAFRAVLLPDYTKLVGALRAAFDGSSQPGSALPVLYDGLGAGTKIPPAKAPLYDPQAAAAPGVDEPTQGSAYASALKTAACQPTAAGVLLDRLVDAPSPGGQDGLRYPDGSAKASLGVLGPSLTQAQRGILAVCPGLAAPAATTALAFPPQSSYPAGTSSWSVELGCARDCLYLVTLDRASDGAPMLARRGALQGGAPSATVTLPALPVPAGSYRLTVRLVNQVNPGAVVAQQSPPITVH
jgi:hypothetical protein